MSVNGENGSGETGGGSTSHASFPRLGEFKSLVALISAIVTLGATTLAAVSPLPGKAVNLWNSFQGSPISIREPEPGQQVTPCVAIKGTGSPDDGKAIVVGVQWFSEDQIYFEQNITVDSSENQWSATVTLGKDRDLPTKDGKQPTEARFRIYAITMDQDLAEYLATMHTFQDQGNRWWSSPRMPEGATEEDRVIVTRTKSGKC
jgi:hypothetical protein